MKSKAKTVLLFLKLILAICFEISTLQKMLVRNIKNMILEEI